MQAELLRVNLNRAVDEQIREKARRVITERHGDLAGYVRIVNQRDARSGAFVPAPRKSGK